MYRISYLLFSAAFFCIARFIYAAVSRLGFPYELFWMEGFSADHLDRVLNGLPIYAKPSIEFIAYTYTPCYFYLTSVIAQMTGGGFFPLRLVSFLATIGIFYLCFLWTRKTLRAFLPGAIAAGLYAVTFEASGSWFDTARGDSLCLLFLLTAFYLLRRTPSFCLDTSAAILIWLSFFTKQVGLIAALPLLLYLLLTETRRGFLVCTVLATLVTSSTLFMNHISDNWFSFYVFTAQRNRWINHITWYDFWKFWIVEISITFLPIIVLILMNSVQLVRTLGARQIGKDLAIFLGLIGAACFGRMESINFLNSLMPAHLGFSLLLGTILSVTWLEGKYNRTLITYALCAMQFFILSLSSIDNTPNARDREAGDHFIQFIRSVNGEVYLPEHGYLPTMAGQRSFANFIGINDVLLGDDGTKSAPLLQEIEEVLAAKRFAIIVLDPLVSGFENWFKKSLEQHYQLKKDPSNGEKILIPVAGFNSTALLYFPKTAEQYKP